MAKNQVFISLGTNLGDRADNLKKAILAIESMLGALIEKSSIYETKPWGNTIQPDFLNQVIIIQSEKDPQACLHTLATIEKLLGRQREERWGARIIDLDLLYVDDAIINTDELILPHPGIRYRKFVLVPLVEIAPDYIHPQLLLNQHQLLDMCTDSLEVKLLKA